MEFKMTEKETDSIVGAIADILKHDRDVLPGKDQVLEPPTVGQEVKELLAELKAGDVKKETVEQVLLAFVEKRKRF